MTPVSNIDSTALQNYNTLLLEGKTEADATRTALSGVNAETRAVATSLNQLNARRRAGLLTDEQYTTQLNGMIVQTEQLTLAQKASAFASKAMGVALNMALNVGIGIAISAIISLISKAVNASKVLKQKAEERKQQSIENAKAADEEVNSLNELISQYKELATKTSLTTSDKESLKNIQSELIEKYGLEADAVNLVNGSYDEQLAKLKQIKAEKIEANLNNSIVELDNVKGYYNTNDTNQLFADIDSGANKTIGELKNLYDALNNIEGVDFSSSNIEAGLSSGTLDQYTNDVVKNGSVGLYIDKNLNSKQKAEITKLVSDTIKQYGFQNNFEGFITTLNEWQGHYKEETDNYNEKFKSYAQKMFDVYTTQEGNGTSNITKNNYQEWYDGLVDYTKSHVSSENFDEVVNSFNDVFNENQLKFHINIDTGEIEEIKQTLSSAITTANDHMEDYKETISTTIDNTTALTDAISEQTSGDLSYDTVTKLIDAGYNTAVKYDEVLNKYVLDTEKANEISQDNLSSSISNLVSEKNSLTEAYQSELEKLTTIKPQSAQDVEFVNDKKVSLTNDYNNAISELDNQLGILKITQDEVSQSTNKYKIYVDEAKSSVEKYSGVLSTMDDNASTVNSAWKEQSEDGKLSVSTIQKLIEAGYESAICFDEQTGSATLLQDVMNGLVNSQLAEKQAEIEVQKVDLTTKYNEAAKAVDTYRKSINSASDAQIYNNAIANKNSLQAELDKLGVLSDSYKGVYNDIWTLDDKSSNSDSSSAEDKAQEAHDAYVNAFEKEKSSLDHLKDMQVISDEDYYSQLLQLVRQYYYGKSEYLSEYQEQEKELFDNYKDLEKEALQNQIDMLQEANDERENAISLEEKKIALENAQKQKIKTYSTETGFTYTQDKQAIEDAQKDYNDELVSQQIDALEKLKDSIDTNTNTAHTSDELTDVLSQVSSVTGVNTSELIKPSEMTTSQFVDWVKSFDMTKLNSVLNNSIVPTLPNVAMATPNTQNITNNNNNKVTVTIGEIITNDADSFTKKDFPKALSDGLTDFFTQAESYNITHK